jgi:hypothetical protein
MRDHARLTASSHIGELPRKYLQQIMMHSEKYKEKSTKCAACVEDPQPHVREAAEIEKADLLSAVEERCGLDVEAMGDCCVLVSTVKKLQVGPSAA